MTIVARLRGSFECAGAWKPGYGILLRILEAEGGHSPEAARKAGQLGTNLTTRFVQVKPETPRKPLGDIAALPTYYGGGCWRAGAFSRSR
jgi:hypothetical protein